MRPNEIVNIPHIDEDGYYDAMVSCMVDQNGELMLGADCYDIDPPEQKEGYFYKLSEDHKSWIAEKIPTTPEECIGLVLAHEKQTDRIHKLRETFERLTNNSTEYRLVQDPETNARSIEKIPEKTIDEVRTAKENELESAFNSWYNDGATMISSLGFEVDSDSRAMQDVTGLVTAAESQTTFAETGLIFMDAHNQGHQVNLKELKVLQLEIIAAGNAAYQEKWRIRDLIAAAKTKEELEAIEIKFHPANFGASE